MGQSVAKGSITLTVEENELEARLDFAPDKDGAEWTADKVQKLALDARLPAIQAKRAEEIVSKFSRSRGPVAELIAEGLPPEDPVSENVEWAELEVPAELGQIVDGLLASAEAPELYRIRVKTLKTEKKVSKPGALPFLPAKVETVVVSEKVETREAVHPDLEIAKSGYARRGESIGVLFPAKPGKPGKSIFGKPLQFSGDSETFILGKGVSRVKNDLVADVDGVVRAGAIWVELLPLAAHTFKVERSSDGTTILLDYLPGHRGLPRPEAELVLASAKKLGARPEDLVEGPAIAAALAEAAASGTPLLGWSLSPDRDAEVKVEVAADGTRATLTIRKGRGRGKALELAAVTAALKASGLRGLRNDEIKKTVMQFYKGADAELTDYLLAEGKEPTRGKPRSLVLAISPITKEKAAALRDRIVGHADLEKSIPSLAEYPIGSLSSLAFVNEGQKVAELSALDMGQPGLDIRGTILPGLPGNDPVVRGYEGISVTKDAVIATRGGLLMAEEKSGAWYFRVVPCRDAFIQVDVSSDGMEGLLTLRAEEGLGRPLDVESVVQAIGERGIVFGLDPRSIAEAVADARAAKPVLKRVVARGRPPVAAGGKKHEWLIGTGAGPSSGLRVGSGQELFRITTNPGAGVEGQDVLGKPLLPPSEAEAARAPEHDGTVKEEVRGEGVSVLVAAVSGEVVLAEGKLTIRDKLKLARDVSPQDGDLRFGGTVDIQGSILTGARLFAGGDVRVSGGIDAAVVSSEGTVSTGGGVKGGRRGTIRAMRSLELAFAENALLLAVEDIVIRGACTLCNVKTNGRLSVQGGKGSLVGGLIRARKGIEADSLGSAAGVKTEVAFGQDYLVADMIENEEREIEKVKTAILQSDRMMAELERAGAGLDQVRQDKVKLLKLLEKRSVRLFDFREKFEQHFPSEVRIRGAVFPGVILESHNRFFEVRSRKNGVAFSFDPSNGRIVERPLK